MKSARQCAESGAHMAKLYGQSPRYPSHDAALLLPEAPERKSEASARWPFHWQNPPLGGIFANHTPPITPPKCPAGRAKKVQASKAELLCGCQHGTVTASRLGLALGLDLNMLFFGSFLSRKSRE